MTSQTYAPGGVVTAPKSTPEDQPPRDWSDRRMTVKEAEAVLTLVRGGWLKLEITLAE